MIFWHKIYKYHKALMKNYKTFMQERVKMLIYIRQSNLKKTNRARRKWNFRTGKTKRNISMNCSSLSSKLYCMENAYIKISIHTNEIKIVPEPVWSNFFFTWIKWYAVSLCKMKPKRSANVSGNVRICWIFHMFLLIKR